MKLTLTTYLLKRFLAWFSIFFLTLTAIFGVSDVLIRMAATPSFFSVPTLFILLLPLMAVLSLPLAASLAVSVTAGTLYQENEAIPLRYLRRTRRAVYTAIAIFTILVASIYAPLILRFAPRSYWHAKNYLISSAREQFDNLQPESFHTLVPDFTFYYQQRGENDEGRTVYKQVVLLVRDNSGLAYVIAAQECYLANDMLIITNGSVQNNTGDTWYVGNFEETQIDLAKLLSSGGRIPTRHLKFFTSEELSQLTEPAAMVEYHKRWVQILWLLLLPLLSWLLMLVVARRASNILRAVGASGSLFLFSYITTSLSQTLAGTPTVALLVLYGYSSGAAVVIFYLYYRRWK